MSTCGGRVEPRMYTVRTPLVLLMVLGLFFSLDKDIKLTL